jgi:hypothetical protein
MEHSKEIKQFIRDKSDLFWYTPKDKKEDISLDFLVETILNYGDSEDVKRLFSLLGINEVARIFEKQTNRSRINYFPRTAHYFKLYFEKYAKANSKS